MKPCVTCRSAYAGCDPYSCADLIRWQDTQHTQMWRTTQPQPGGLEHRVAELERVVKNMQDTLRRIAAAVTTEAK